MISDRPYLQNWRPVYELSSAVVWFFAMITAYTLSFFSSLPQIGFVLTASFCATMMVIRLSQALPRWQQHQRLKGKKLALLELTSKQCQLLQTKNREQGVWLGWGFEWQRLHGQRAWDLLRNDNLPAKSENTMGAGWIHGMEEHEERLYQPLEQIQMHTMVIGVPGSGKTRLFDLLVTQAVLRNEPVIIVDPKGDHDLASHTLRSCGLSGNQYRFMKFHPGFPANSIRINLLQNFNRSSELASRISGLMPSGGDNAPFQAFAQKAVDAVVQGYLLCGQRPTLVMIRQGLEGGVTGLLIKALTIVCTRHQAQAADIIRTKEVKAKTNPEAEARRWIDFYRNKVVPESPCTDVEGLISLFEHDRSHYGKMIATLLPALGMLTGGPLARLLSPDPTDIDDLRPCTHTANLIEQNKVMYFGLDSLSDPMVGKAIGQLLLADLAAVAGDRYNYSDNSDKPINLFVDEAAEVLCPQLLSLLNKGRGAKFRLYVATQTLADFEAQLGSKAAAQQFIDNCNHLICLRTQNPDTQKFITDKQQYAQRLGQENALWIMGTGNQLYAATIVKSGIHSFLMEHTTTDRNSGEGLAKAMELFQGVVKNFLSLIRQLFYRISVLLACLPFWGVMFIAAIIDGLLIRKIRYHDFHYTSPLQNLWSRRASKWIPGLFLYLIIIPLPLPVLLIPGVAWLTALCLGWWTANWQKKV